MVAGNRTIKWKYNNLKIVRNSRDSYLYLHLSFPLSITPLPINKIIDDLKTLTDRGVQLLYLLQYYAVFQCKCQFYDFCVILVSNIILLHIRVFNKYYSLNSKY